MYMYICLSWMSWQPGYFVHDHKEGMDEGLLLFWSNRGRNTGTSMQGG